MLKQTFTAVHTGRYPQRYTESSDPFHHPPPNTEDPAVQRAILIP